ncbi:EPIDERMAL PATTERNING FACTOR-like protein 1 [Actinidia eriantha]|uniref:EPIDERMAL PATTERNING FACTOR-like protein 1 n=1 Tax=Actinidia eriantha TaxID=165200 RepID=UPI0025888552|nr:EPIDERMAL PATTERNING FACTOR-like protein 1 [Actinidia eriantha]
MVAGGGSNISENKEGHSVILKEYKGGYESMTIGAETSEEGSGYKGVDQMGSRPPSCEHKCYGCMPCEAIQVPTTTSRVGLQYTNYEPESWKCKCGPSFYSP